MAEYTKIQWTDHTFNPWIGCSAVAEGCKNCYAEFLMDTRYGRVEWGPNGTRVRTKTWGHPRRWNRQAAQAGERRKVFCASLADIFEDFKGDSLAPWRRDLFSNVIDETPWLSWLLLTKRPENIRRMWPDASCREIVWLGTSIANQKNAEANIDHLVECRPLAKYLFLSVEPQIGRVNLERWLLPKRLVDWVIVGGESKQGKDDPRPFSLEWAACLVDQCQRAEVPVFVKQMGARVLHNGSPMHFRDSHGGDMAEWPEQLRVRQCPDSSALTQVVQAR